MAAANEITARDQPKACSSGTMSTPGVALRPAATRSVRKTIPTTTKA